MGHWAEPLRIERLAHELTWLAPKKTGLQTWQGFLGKKAVAVIRKSMVQNTYSLRVPGWIWTAQPPGSTAHALKISQSPVYGFGGLRQTKSAAVAILALLQSSNTPSQS